MPLVSSRSRRSCILKMKVLAFVLLLIMISEEPVRRYWVRPFLRTRNHSRTDLLYLANLDDTELEAESIQDKPSTYFEKLVRLTKDDFYLLHDLVKNIIARRDTNFRKAITTERRLALTLRFLATGDSYDTIEKLFKVSKSSICEIIPETCRAIIQVLQPYMQTPQNEAEWRRVAAQFERTWNFPNCCGAIDGRHCPIISPKFSGSEFYNYKNFFSIVLMAVVDANYKFIYIDVGSQGRISDGGVFNHCSFKHKLDDNSLNLPPPRQLPRSTVPVPVPHVFVADDAFPLTENIMKPIKGITDQGSPERMYNYRVSRARRVVENAFGIFSAKFRVLRKPMCLGPETASVVVMVCCYLHNFMRRNEPDVVAPNDDDSDSLEEESEDGLIHWRNYPRQSSQRAKQVQQEFIRYFFSEEGKVSWDIPYH